MINYIQFYFTQFNTKISLRAILGQQGLKKKKNSSKLLTDFPSRKSVKMCLFRKHILQLHLLCIKIFVQVDQIHKAGVKNASQKQKDSFGTSTN